MDRLRALKYFIKVAETSSFTATAKSFGVPASSVSRRIRDLEGSLGADLFQRSTRMVRLTGLGSLYYQQVRAAVDALTEADDIVSHHSSAPEGLLRITAMPGYGAAKLMPALDKFQALYPAITLDVELTDQVFDLARSGIDIALRATATPPERAVAKPLDSNRFILMASPAYLAANGSPKCLADLATHKALVYRGPGGILQWQARSNGPNSEESSSAGWRDLKIEATMISNHGQALLQAAEQGRGLMLLPEWAVEAPLKQGSLVKVELEDGTVSSTRVEDPRIYLMYFKPKYHVQKVKVAVDFLMAELATDAS